MSPILDYGSWKMSQATMRWSWWRAGVAPVERRCYNTTNKVLLTFDDSASEARVSELLTVLRRESVLAAFFVVGAWAVHERNVVDAIKASGHWVFNHSATHSNLLRLSDDEVRAEVLGGVAGALFRPPGGRLDARTRGIVQELGYRLAFWSVDTADWQGRSAADMIRHVSRSVKPGSCVLMHLDGEHTLEALPEIIRAVRARGLELCSNGTELAV
ncbi:hypothetical protein acdb102_19500 [Acidothermaceae bacterium B102]|nr:hypothetical protein acdb102_19500 [Acidothermaceae bacterium B102]